MNKGPIDGFFLFLADKFNGKKTLTGVVLIVGGLATIVFTPEHKDAGISLLASGIPMLLIGYTHKVVKKSDGIQH